MKIIHQEKKPGAVCDIHILTRPGLRPDAWLEAAVQSVDLQDCNWFVVDGSEGHMGRLRTEAFKLGSARYVSFVDDDDVLLPGAVEKSIAALEACKCTGQTYSNVERSGCQSGVQRLPYNKGAHLSLPNQCWHFHMFRRKQVETVYAQLQQEPVDEEFLLCGLMCKFGQPRHIDETLYRWRCHGNCHAGRAIDTAARARTIRQVATTVMKAKAPCKG